MQQLTLQPVTDVEGPWPLPDGWAWRTLGGRDGVCNINPRRPQFIRALNAPTSFLPMEAVDEVTGTIKELQTREYAAVRSGFTYFEEDDILFAKITPSMQNGKSAIARGLRDGLGFGSTEFHVFRAKPFVLPEWIHFYIRRLSFRQEAMQTFKGAVGHQRVPPEFLEMYSIPLPFPNDPEYSLSVQRAIISHIEEILGEVGDMRNDHKITDNNINLLVDAVLRESLRELDRRYPVVPISDLLQRKLLKVTGGGTPTTTQAAYWTGPIPWVSPKDMKAWIIADAEDHVSPLAVERTSVKLISAGSVLFVVRGMILARLWPIGVTEAEVTINQDMKALTPTTAINPYYLAYILRGRASEVLQQVEIAAHGTRRLKTEVIESTGIPLPSREVQDTIVAHFDAVQAEVIAMQQHQRDLGSLLGQLEQAALEQAFHGKL